MQSEQVEAIVIRLVDYGESDRIAGLLTPNYGKISAFAAGARKSKKRFGGALDLFSYVRAEVRQPKSADDSLWRLSQIHLTDLHLGVRQNLSCFATASYLSECIWLLAGERDPQILLFSWWKNTLEKLSKEEPGIEHDLRLDLELLRICGYEPRWNMCTDCSKPAVGDRFFFSFGRGGITCKVCQRGGAGRWISAKLRSVLEDQQTIPKGERDAFRKIIHAYVSHTLGKEPKSQKFREEVLYGSST